MSSAEEHILVVEDITQIRELLEVTLRFQGYPVVSAQNGEEALEKIAEQRPVLIITDLLMPKMDGYTLLYRLRSNPETQDIPTLVLSATYVDGEDKNFALSLGAVRFMEKPVDIPEFLLAIGEIIAAGPRQVAEPIDERIFLESYQTRLERKLQQKIHQIRRTQRLLITLPEAQTPAFQTLLTEAREQREQIEAEMNRINGKLQALDDPS
ncbi:MAG: response regulator [Anaerolineae bacterium]|nr:response regulator [Anaerolineae bacterium]